MKSDFGVSIEDRGTMRENRLKLLSILALPSSILSFQEPMPQKLTPMMERYLEVKAQNPGSILLFRMGDFYELFYEDAKIAAKILGLNVTSRDKSSENPVPMAGFPYHALDNYLQKLIAAGCRAAICEQVEDPKLAKGLVKREVTQIVTPGTLTDEALLDPRNAIFWRRCFPAKRESGWRGWNSLPANS